MQAQPLCAASLLQVLDDVRADKASTRKRRHLIHVSVRMLQLEYTNAGERGSPESRASAAREAALVLSQHTSHAPDVAVFLYTLCPEPRLAWPFQN